MKTSKILFSMLAGFALVGCAQDESRLWVAFQAKPEKTTSARRPAQSNPVRCFVDRLNPDVIRKEITEMESNYPKQGETAFEFGGQQYSDLTASTIDFLSKKGFLDKSTGSSWIAASTAQVTCKTKTADCFVQSLYPTVQGVDQESKLEGLLHYWFFLKTGYLMSAQKAYPWYQDGSIVTVAPKDVALEKYLFTEDEWKAWWKMAHLLPPSMLRMPSLKTVHRTPRGHTPDAWKSNKVCGIAAGWWNAGLVLLDDGCLTLSKTNVFDTHKYFYPATTHEFAHRLSAWNFSTNYIGPRTSLAESEEFLSLSNWKKAELVTRDGKSSMEWKSAANAKFVSSYAKTNPSEDFAETVGYFRTNGIWTRKSAPLKYAFVKKKVFGGLGYAADDIQTQYVNRAIASVTADVEKWTKPCLEKVVVAPTLTNIAYSKLANELRIADKAAPAIGKCIKNALVNEVLGVMDEIRYQEPEGCTALKQIEPKVVEAAVQRLTIKINSYVKLQPKLSVTSGVKAYRDAMDAEFREKSREPILECWRLPEAEDCYQQRLTSIFGMLNSRHAMEMKIQGEEFAKSEQERFETAHSYGSVALQMNEFYNGLMSSVMQKIPARAEAIWKKCKTATEKYGAKPLLKPYSAGNHYLPPESLTCLNQELENEFIQLRADAGADQEVAILAESARTWIDQKILQPAFKEHFDRELASLEKEDEARFLKVRSAGISEVFSTMDQDRGWQEGDIFKYGVCKAEVSRRLIQKFPEENYRYLSLGGYLDAAGNEVCERIRLSSKKQQTNEKIAVNAAADRSGAKEDVPAALVEKAPPEIWKRLSVVMVLQAQGRFDHCKKSDVYFTKRLRRFCLFNELVEDGRDVGHKRAWVWTRDHAIQLWMADAEVAKFRALKSYSDQAFFDAMQSYAEEDSQFFVDAIVDAFHDTLPDKQEE